MDAADLSAVFHRGRSLPKKPVQKAKARRSSLGTKDYRTSRLERAPVIAQNHERRLAGTHPAND